MAEPALRPFTVAGCQPYAASGEMPDRRAAVPFDPETRGRHPTDAVKPGVIHVRDKNAQRLVAPFMQSLAVVGGRSAANNDVADRIVEIRNMRPIKETCRHRYHVLLTEGSGRLFQEIGQEGIVTCIHGARL